MDKKIKVLVISDHPMAPSGVGTQTKYVIEALLKTGNYQVVSLGGAIKHQNYQPVKTEQFGDDWIIHPVDGYGTKEMIDWLKNQSIERNWEFDKKEKSNFGKEQFLCELTREQILESLKDNVSSLSREIYSE